MAGAGFHYELQNFTGLSRGLGIDDIFIYKSSYALQTEAIAPVFPLYG